MRKGMPAKDILIKHKLKTEDPLELPMDDSFYENMHDRIMHAVENADMESPKKWQKTRVFLEQGIESHRHLPKKSMKLALVGLLTSFGIGFVGVTQQIYANLQPAKAMDSQNNMVQEAQKESEKSDLAAAAKSKGNRS